MAALFSVSRRLLTFLPELHTVAEDHTFVSGHMLPRQLVTIAERDGRMVGFMAETPGWIEHLYIAPEARRTGVGTALLGDAKSRSDALQLWCFRDNHPARAFYARHGFAVLEQTNGEGNEQRMPDVRLGWRRAGSPQ